MSEQTPVPPPSEMPQLAMQEVRRGPKSREEIALQVGRIANKLIDRSSSTLAPGETGFGDESKGETDITLFSRQGGSNGGLSVESPDSADFPVADRIQTNVFARDRDGEESLVTKSSPAGRIRVDAGEGILRIQGIDESRGNKVWKDTKLTRDQTIHAAAGMLSEVRGRLATHEKRTIEKNSQKIDEILKAR